MALDREVNEKRTAAGLDVSLQGGKSKMCPRTGREGNGGAAEQLVSRGDGSLVEVGGEQACPGVADQKQTEPEGPRPDGGQEEGHEAVGLQEEVAGVGLPGEEQQHEQVHRQQPPLTARPHQVGPEAAVVAVAVQQAPAEVRGEGDVEEEQLAGRQGAEG